MKIRSIRVNQWANFTTPCGIEGLSDGLNVLVAPNESGKSSLVSALRHALFSRHKTQGGPLRPFINEHTQGAPVVEVSFEIDGELYTIRKRFLRSKFARLTSASGATDKQAEPAEAALQELLGYEQTRGGLSNREALGMWPILLAEQGDTLSPLTFHPGAQVTVLGALEETVGNVMGGLQGRALPALVKEQLSAYLTPARGSPTGRYRDAAETLDRLRGELDELRAREAAVQRDLDDYARHRQAYGKLEDDDAARELAADLQQARDQLRRLAEIDQRIREAQALRDREVQAVNDARQRIRDRETLERRIDELRSDIAARTEALSQVDAEERRLRSLWEEARDRYADSSEGVRAAGVRYEAARQRASKAELLTRLKQAGERLERVEALEQQVRALSASLERNPVTTAVLDDIEALHRELEGTRARLAGSATLVDFDLEAGAAERVSLDNGQRVDTTRALEVLSEAVIHIRDVGRITVRPQLDDVQALEGAFETQHEALLNALAAIGAADLAAARAMAQQRARIASELTTARATLEAHAPQDAGGPGQVRAERDRLAASLSAGGDGADAEGAAAQLSAEALARARSEAEQNYHDARAAADTASLHRDAAREAYEGSSAAAKEPRAALLTLQSTLASESERLDGMPPAADLAAALKKASDALALATAEVERRRADLQGQSIEQLTAKVRRLEGSLQTLNETKDRLIRDIATLEGRLTRDGGAGIGEQIASRERDMERAQAEYDYYERESDILRTLDGALGRAEREARDRFLGPITQRVAPYLGVLFPEAEVEMDEALNVTAIRRRDQAASDLSLLSKGTQEQINILVRIAIAELLAEQGRPSLLVLDDAMAFADDERTEKMLDILTMASERIQILLLTCHENTFRRAGGTRLEILRYPETQEMATA